MASPPPPLAEWAAGAASAAWAAEPATAEWVWEHLGLGNERNEIRIKDNDSRKTKVTVKAYLLMWNHQQAWVEQTAPLWEPLLQA